MRAAVVSELGRSPRPGELADPTQGDAETLVEIEAAPLNPIDLAVAAGRNPAGHPPLPFVPGCEGVGTAGGRRVWVFREGIGITRNGCMAERVAAPRDAIAPVPDGADPAVAAAMGIAGMAGWASLSWRVPVREDDVVLVLGATGTVGSVAVQAARILGAARVVAAGRDREALDRVVADAKVPLEGNLVEAFRDACHGGPTLIFDPLWGEPAAAAAEAAKPGARIVQLGQSAGATAPLTSAAVRFKGLEIYGYSDFILPKEILDREYARLVEHAMNGDIQVEIEQLPLDRVADAWEQQAASPHRKLVLIP
jgi:NADPH:quinone reductase-like Zn-dependent oxidoreductase